MSMVDMIVTKVKLMACLETGASKLLEVMAERLAGEQIKEEDGVDLAELMGETINRFCSKG